IMERSKTQYVDNTAQLSSAGLIIRQKEPKNLESPFDRIDSYLTPTELFYIRSHFPIPTLDRASYKLRIDGAVRSPFALSYDELRNMPSETRVATLECAGNSRVFLVPQVQGAQWELGAVSNAEWTGVPLRALLERAGLSEDACEIVLEGADCGTPKEKPVPPEPISYTWSLPRAKAIQPEVLIAYQMNGRDLPRDHGFPAPVRRNETQIRNCTTTCLRNLGPKPYLHSLGRCMDGRDRRDRNRSEHRWWPNLGRGRIPGSRATPCVAPLEIRVAHAARTGAVHLAGPRQGRGRPDPT